MQNGKSSLKHMVMINTDDNINIFKEMTDRVHVYNTPIILQVAHCGRQTRSKLTGYPTVAPSPIRDKLYNEDKPLELNETEIFQIINNFVLCIERAKKSGFDGVQLHLAHGYLLSSFLSPHMNKRKDKWGGNTENRFKIVKEILLRARKLVGNYPIIAKINAYEKSSDGMNIHEAITISQYLEKFGCDAIEVSCGIGEDGFYVTRGDFPFDFIIFALIIGLYSLLSKNKGYKLSTIIRIKVIGAAVLLFSIFLTKQFIIFYEDIPAAINSNYSYFNGKLANFYVSHGKSTSTYVTIENEKFKINGDISKKGYLVNGDTYAVEFLPNSKYVIALYRYENSSKINQ